MVTGLKKKKKKKEKQVLSFGFGVPSVGCMSWPVVFGLLLSCVGLLLTQLLLENSPAQPKIVSLAQFLCIDP